jgi:hypothetical protein
MPSCKKNVVYNNQRAYVRIASPYGINKVRSRKKEIENAVQIMLLQPLRHRAKACCTLVLGVIMAFF